MSEQRLLPIDIDAERSVLAALLATPEAFLDVSTVLAPEDFGLAAHDLIYRAALGVDAAGKPIDQITIADELRRMKSLAKAGGVEAINELIDYAGEAINLPAHVQIVADKSKLRRLAMAGQNIYRAAVDPQVDAASALNLAESTVFEIGRTRSAGTLTEMSQAVPRMLEELAKARTSVLVGQSTGFADLDRMTGGLQGGQLILVAARPAMGKSAFATQLARHIADSSGKAVPLLSYEMSTTEITMRLLASALEYDLHKLRQGDIPNGMESDLQKAAIALTTSPILIDDNPPETISGVRSAMRRLAARRPLGAIVVDYLQLLSGEGNGRDENRNQEVSAISRGLKRLSSELDVPVIALSQLNRSLEQRAGSKRPMLSDLRDSGSLEQDASMVWFLHREHVFNAAADPTAAELIIAKQRNGPVGTVNLNFNGGATKFASGGGPAFPPMSAAGGGDPWGSTPPSGGNSYAARRSSPF